MQAHPEQSVSNALSSSAWFHMQMSICAFHFLSVSRAFVFRSDDSVINTPTLPATAEHIANMITETQVMIVHEKEDMCAIIFLV